MRPNGIARREARKGRRDMVGSLDDPSAGLNRKFLGRSEYCDSTGSPPRGRKRYSEAHMNRVLVLFDSQTGNVRRMAELVAEGAQTIADTEVRLRLVEEATADDVRWCDGLAVGSPTNMGILSWKMKRFWDETMGPAWMQVDGKIACAFSSAGGWGGGMELACQSILTVLMNFGFLTFGVTPSRWRAICWRAT
ncbi:MAG: flavodoxin family protein [Verrucomicrobiota bacterium]